MHSNIINSTLKKSVQKKLIGEYQNMQQYDIYEIVEDMLKTVCQDNNKITLNQIREYTNIMIQDIDMMMYEFYNNNGEY